MRKKGFSTAAIVIGVIIVAILCVGTIVVINNQKEAVDYTPYMGETVVEATEANGQIADHIIGNADAPVVIHEYANFQCNHCAAMRPVVEQVVADSNGQLAVVFRNLTWSAFQNSKAAAAAAEAAFARCPKMEDEAELIGAYMADRLQEDRYRHRFWRPLGQARFFEKLEDVAAHARAWDREVGWTAKRMRKAEREKERAAEPERKKEEPATPEEVEEFRAELRARAAEPLDGKEGGR